MEKKGFILRGIIYCVGIFSLIKSLSCIGVVIGTIQEANDPLGYHIDNIFWYFRMNPYEILTTLSFLIIAIYLLLQGSGLIKKRHFGRMLAVLFPVVYILFMIICRMTIVRLTDIIVSVLYGIFLLAFFTRPKVKEQFK